MNGYFVFDYFESKKRVRVLFTTVPEPLESKITTALQRVGDISPPPDRLRFLFPANKELCDAFSLIVNGPSFKNRFREFSRHVNPPDLDLWTFDQLGHVRKLGESTRLDAKLIASLSRAGMTNIFRDRKGLLTAQNGYHYTKPSGHHSQHFLRIGNVMTCSSEVDFLAFSCLPFVPIDVQSIYCDTGAIFPVAYSIAQLRIRLSSESKWPTIDSFGSYSGLSSARFETPEQSLVLISASTSGGLASKVQIHEPSLSDKQIATLFFLGQTEKGQIVCNLNDDATIGVEGFAPFHTYSEEANCSLCQRGWLRIALDGEQFLPGASHTRSIVIKRANSPGSWLSQFVQQVKQLSIVKVHYRDSYSKYEVFLDIEKMFGSLELLNKSALMAKFEWMVNQNVPYSTTRLIHLEDSASTQMAKAIKQKLDLISENVQLISIKDVSENPADHVQDKGSSVVVASAISSGRSLLGVSLQLRSIQKNGSFQYIVGVVRCPSRQSVDELKQNLIFGPRPHGFWYLQDLYLPFLGDGKRDSWDEELEFLNQLTNQLENDNSAKTFFDSRIAEIQKSSDVRIKGLETNLFLESVCNGSMQLRGGFAFLDFDFVLGQITQAETFLVMTAVLNHMRQSSGDSGLKQSSFVRTVLSPRCFDRFNDGVIQSSILRAATPAELDYSADGIESGEMRRIIEVLLSNARNEVGEAAREFVLAIATGRLRLTTEDENRLRREIGNLTDDPICRSMLVAVH